MTSRRSLQKKRAQYQSNLRSKGNMSSSHATRSTTTSTDAALNALMMDYDKPEECTVCCDNYDEALRRPRTLPCGHTFCSQCIETTFKNNELVCPSCRTEHIVASTSRFPVNYGMEAFIRKLGCNATSESSSSAKRKQDGARGISKKLRSLAQEQKSSISSLISNCEEVLSQMGEYRGQLRDWKTQHHQLQDKLDDLAEQNKAAIELLEREDTSVVDMATQVEEGKKQLETMLGNFDTVNTKHVVVTTEEVEDWLQKCQDVFPDVNTVHTSVKVQETIREAMLTTEAAIILDPISLEELGSSIMEKVGKIAGEISPEMLTVEHLRRMTEPAKRLLEAGRVLAVQQDEDDLRSARITLQDGQLYLHPLLRQPLPAHSRTLQHSDILGMLDPTFTLVFLDLGWGSTRGRVTIRLAPDTGLARQFVLLCTGQHTHTYAGTKLLRVGGKGQQGECVVGGDYERDDGRGGASLLPDLQGDYRRGGFAGTVWSPCWWPEGPEDHRSAQFGISTRDRTDGQRWPGVFGNVENGLDVVRAATNHSDIKEVTIVDCGIVLPV
nr:tripartite motif-containing protein 5-like isoform X2 [Procambarus clarkii]